MKDQSQEWLLTNTFSSTGGSPTPVGYMVPSESMKPVAATDGEAEED